MRTVTTQVQLPTRQLGRGNLSWIRQVTSGTALTAVVLTLLTGSAEAASFSFDKTVNSNTPIPNEDEGKFSSFSAPSLDNGKVAFSGSGGDQYGIYTKTGKVLNTVADTNTPIPSGTSNFNYFRQ